MRRAMCLAVLMVPALALARTSVHVGGGGGGHRGRGGLSLHYRGSSGHSSWSFRFSGGSGYCGGSRYVGGYSGSYYAGAPGVAIYRGWAPCDPALTSGYVAFGTRRGVGPYSYVDGVHFSGTGGALLFAPPRPQSPPPAPGLDRLSAGQLIDRGDDLFGRRDYAGAAAAYRAAAGKAPNDPMTAYALGHGLFAVADYAGAAAALRRGVQLYPGLLKTRMARRDFYAHGADFDAQLTHLERHVQARPDGAAARFVLGYNCFFSQRPEKAREQFTALGAGDREAQLFLAELAAR